MINITQISLENTKPGTKLGHDVLDAKGSRLLTAGSVLTEQVLSMLERRNITHIHIASEVMMSPEQLDIKKSEIEESLAFRFREANTSKEMKRFKSILLDYQLGKLA